MVTLNPKPLQLRHHGAADAKKPKLPLSSFRACADVVGFIGPLKWIGYGVYRDLTIFYLLQGNYRVQGGYRG